MASRCGLFLLVFLWSFTLHEDFARRLVVWNVGQGQWVTLIEPGVCWHFDTGGEKIAWKKLMAACRGRLNRMTYSHWDWDHISFAARLGNYVPRVCVDYPPTGPSTARKEKILRRLPKCGGRPAVFETWTNDRGRTANDKSRVVWWKGILIPGDSPSGEEKHWVPFFKHLRETKIFIVGHHGSRTSTSQTLLDQLPYVSAAIASSRRQRYGHPHPQVERELRLRRIPLLTTEDWGNLIFDLN